MIRLMMLLSILLLPSAIFAQPKVDQTNLIVIEGPITSGSMQPIYAATAKLLASKSVPKQLSLVLNSPGGSVVAGNIFITQIKALQGRGVQVSCYVANIAASMAFHILLHCDNRYSLHESFLLWHRARIMMGGMFGEPMTGPQLNVLAKQLLTLDEHIYNDIRKILGGSEEYLRFHFEAETLHVGEQLAQDRPDFIASYNFIPGLFEALLGKSGARTQRESFFDVVPGDLIYIWEGNK